MKPRSIVTPESIEGVYRTYVNVTVRVDYLKVTVTDAVMEENEIFHLINVVLPQNTSIFRRT